MDKSLKKVLAGVKDGMVMVETKCTADVVVVLDIEIVLGRLCSFDVHTLKRILN